MLLALLIPLALADPDAPPRDYEAWERLYDARLDEALGGDPAAALKTYQDKVLADVTEDNAPLSGEARYWVALAALETGDLAQAQKAIDAIADPSPGLADRVRLLRARIEVQERAVQHLPYHQDFDGATSPAPWVLSWTRGEGSALTTRTLPDGNGVVAWQTVVRKGEGEDALILPFRPTVYGPESVRMNLRSEGFPARVRLIL